MDAGTEIGWEPYEVALLGGGPRAAVTVAVVALHLLGAVEPGPRRTLCATGPEPEGLGPFEGTVLDCLREPLTARELVRHTDVRLPDPSPADTHRLDRLVAAARPAHMPYTVEVTASERTPER